MYHYLSHIIEKMSEVIKTPAGWIAGFGLFLADSFTGGKLIIYTVVIASVLDLACGIAVSLKRKKFVLSELMRQTVEKIAVYGTVLLALLCIDRLIASDTSIDIAISAGIVGVVITLAETVSFTASLLILFPNNLFLCLFRKMLTGELARKLGCSEEEVDSIISDLKRKKTKKNSNSDSEDSDEIADGTSLMI